MPKLSTGELNYHCPVNESVLLSFVAMAWETVQTDKIISSINMYPLYSVHIGRSSWSISWYVCVVLQIFPPETSQQEFYEATMKSMVKDVLQGENRLLYTYGVTNSGKTYTIQGERHG